MKLLFALLVVPTAASAQVPTFPQSDGAPINMDPGAAASTAAPKPPPQPAQAPPAQPTNNVVIVGPDGKVTYGPGVQPAQPPPSYYYGSGNDQGMGMGGDQD